MYTHTYAHTALFLLSWTQIPICLFDRSVMMVLSIYNVSVSWILQAVCYISCRSWITDHCHCTSGLMDQTVRLMRRWWIKNRLLIVLLSMTAVMGVFQVVGYFLSGFNSPTLRREPAELMIRCPPLVWSSWPGWQSFWRNFVKTGGPERQLMD